MISLIEADEIPTGNLDQLRKDLTEAAAEQTSDVSETPEAAKPKVRVLEVNDDELPENLRGKSFTDVVRMYKESQSTIGRMANDLGTQRQLSDRLLNLKRESDLQSNGGVAAPKVQVNSSELLDNPTEAIERIVTARLDEATKKTQAELDALRTQREAEAFMSRHPDFQDVGKDPDFQSFVQATPLRQRAAVAASRGDWASADELMTEYKDRRDALKGRKKTEEEEVADKNLDAANKATLEGGASASKPSKGGKILRRVDLLRMQMERPEEYYDEATQAVIMKAYQEGRVK